jgi:sigma-E factor negative regulatory protein RseA
MKIEITTEKLSALLDDELEYKDSLSLWTRVVEERDLGDQIYRYGLARECLLAERPLLIDSGFADRISQAIAEEPTVLAPRAMRQKQHERLATLALAASIAVLAVFVGRSINDYSPMRANEMLAQVDMGGSTVKASMEPDLRDYLTMHNESVYMAGDQGLLPSIRLVSGSVSR